MEKILLLTGVLTLLTTSGCLVAEGGGHGHYRGGHAHGAVIVGPPVIVVPAPIIIVP